MVPATRMKAIRRTGCRCCAAAPSRSSAARSAARGGSPLVFTHAGGKLLYDRQLRRLLRKQELAAETHGFRTSCRDWAAETHHLRELVAPAHGRLGGLPSR